MISLIHLIKGYYVILISGNGKERFLNLCSTKRILLWNLKEKGNAYEFCVSKKAYVLLQDIQQKTNITLTIKGEYGLPFFLYRYKRRKFFFVGILCCLLTIYILSLFVWDIQITGTKRYTKEQVEKYLKEKEIHTGILKKKISCSVLEEEIREDFPETAWVSCDLEGTCLSVQLKESLDLSDVTQGKNQVPNDIVASKDGTIVSIITRNGTPLVKKDMKVKKGDTLISGIIYLYNEFDELLETNQISADGDVFAKTTYQYNEEFPLSYYEKVYTDNQKHAYSFFIGDYSLTLPSTKNSFQTYDTISETYPLKIGNHFYLPFSIQVTTYQEYLSKNVTLNKDKAKEKANEKIDYYLNQLIKEGKEIVNKNFAINVTSDCCKISGNATVIESIGKIRNIP